jgi:HEAT repeat protein
MGTLKEGRYGKADSHNTFKAAKVLGEMREHSALPRLKQLANAGEYGHANECGADDEIPIAIAKIAKKDEYAFLRSLLERAERENRVSSGLLEAIGYSEDERSVSLLAEYLNKGDRYRKLDVIIALGHTQSSKAIALLLPYINSEDWHFKEYSRAALIELGRSDLIPKDAK